ncbi:hypothetical protein M5K25_016118 [Dendrobium thyrsiflorum]|uniref:Uncharacterized protein n=1 Tax=Dendrobium thyrsiflorum TaxID=117978 RepID=A0ABD0UZ35_DENTH
MKGKSSKGRSQTATQEPKKHARGRKKRDSPSGFVPLVNTKKEAKTAEAEAGEEWRTFLRGLIAEDRAIGASDDRAAGDRKVGDAEQRDFTREVMEVKEEEHRNRSEKNLV